VRRLVDRSAALLLFRCDALLGIYQITLACPCLWTTHGGITVSSCRNSVTAFKFVRYLPMPVIEPLLSTPWPVILLTELKLELLSAGFFARHVLAH
jgi:hypothetical protein